MELLSGITPVWGACVHACGLGASLLLAPVCIISSDLYQWFLSFFCDMDDQTLLLILSLVTIWGLSLFSTLQLIKTRTLKSIFFYQFVFFLILFNSILVGMTYSLLKRESLAQQLLAKVFTTLLLVYIAQLFKVKTAVTPQYECRVCFNPTEHHDCMILPCGHTYHQGCLWDWVMYRKCCPTCLKPWQK